MLRRIVLSAFIAFLLLFIMPVGLFDANASDSFENYPVVITSGNIDESLGDMLIGQNGEIYVLWREYDGLNYRIKCRNSTDAGRSWNPIMELDSNAAGLFSPSLAQASNGDIYAAYRRTTSPYIVIKRLPFGSTTFLGFQTLGSSVDELWDLAIDGSDGIHVTYTKNSRRDLCVMNSRSSTPWAETIIDSGADINTFSSSVMVCVGGFFALAYVKTVSTISTIYYKTTDDPNWVANLNGVEVQNAGYQSNGVFIDMAITGSDVYVVWNNQTGLTHTLNHFSIRHAKDLGRASSDWGDVNNMDDRISPQLSSTHVAASSNGLVYAAWSEGTDVYYDRSSDYGETNGTDIRVNRDYGSSYQYSPIIRVRGPFGPYVIWQDDRLGGYSNPDLFFEDLSSGRAYSMNRIYDVEGQALDQFDVRDIVSYVGFEPDQSTVEYDFASDRWIEKEPQGAPGVLYFGAMAGTSTKLVHFGGFDGSKGTNYTDVYDPLTNSWDRRTPSLSPPARVYHAMASRYGTSQVVLFGGMAFGTGYLDTTFEYDEVAGAEGTWTETAMGAVTKPTARFGHAMASIYGTDKVVLYGGQQQDGAFSRNTYIYDASTDAWTDLGILDPNPGEMRFTSMSAIADTSNVRKVVLFGGEYTVGPNTIRLGDTWIFNYDTSTSTGSWTKVITPICPKARALCSMAPDYSIGSKKVVLTGGMGNELYYDTWVFDGATYKWTPECKGLSERVASSISTIYGTDNVVVYGGISNYHYSIIGGDGEISIIKFTANNPTVENIVLESCTAGATGCVVNGMAISNGHLFAVGRSSAHAEIWNISLEKSRTSPCVSEDVTRFTWIDDYSTFTNISNDESMAYMQIAAVHLNGEYHLLRTEKDLSAINAYMFTLPISTICYNGCDGYYVFVYSSAGHASQYYYQKGNSFDAPLALAIGNGPQGRINDAVSVVIDDSPVAISTYLACDSYGTATRGMYKLSRVDAAYSISPMNFNGDGDQYCFNYKAIHCIPDVNISGASDSAVYLSVAGECTYASSNHGFAAWLKDVKPSGGSWALETDGFAVTNYPPFYAIQSLDKRCNGGKGGIIGGRHGSPAVYWIEGDAHGDFNITITGENDPPFVEPGTVKLLYSAEDYTTSSSRLNQQFMPTGTDKLAFWVEIVEPNDISTLDYVKLQAWYDDPDGDGSEEPYPSSGTDKNARVEIRYSHSSGQFEMLYPTSSEVAFDAGDCIAENMGNGYSIRLKFVFAPHKQARASRSGDPSIGNSSCTWNFRFECKDTENPPNVCVSNVSSENGWEYGYAHVTSLAGVLDRYVSSGAPVSPNCQASTLDYTLSWSSNNDYRFSVEMKTPLANGADVIAYSNVMAKEATSPTSGYAGNAFTSGDNPFLLENYASFDSQYRKLFWYGNMLNYFDAPTAGSEQSFMTNVLVNVPMGTPSGTYTSILCYVLDISLDAFSPETIGIEAPVGLFEGNDNSYFGTSVASGDFNGDGYSDVAVGEYGYLNAAARGRVSIFFGSDAGLETTPAWSALGETDGDHFGYSLASGDANGDGIDDLAVGAPSRVEGGFPDRGKVYLFTGTAGGLPSMAWSDLGDAGGDEFGKAVSMGDINADGIDDIVIGAPGYDETSLNRGRIYLYFGTPGAPSESLWVAMGQNADDAFGSAVACDGDANGDGHDDILIGASGYDEGGLTSRGKAYLFEGGDVSPATLPSWTKMGDNSDYLFGAAVAFAGDVNGDGYDDALVSATGYSSNRGIVYAFHGSSTSLGNNFAWSCAGEANGDIFGYSIASAGSVNGDAYSDAIVGAIGYSLSKGKAYVFCGGLGGLATISAWSAEGENPGDAFGNSVTSAGDFEGDGFDGVAICAALFDGGGTDRGKVYVYS